MPRLIDADALNWGRCPANGKLVSDWLVEAPTIEAEPVQHGRWEPHPHAYGFVRCSVCHDCNIWGEWADGEKWSYCPHCGAKMGGEQK